jgi:hypothetical protein
VAIHEATGKIATCSKRCVYVYSPYGENDGVLKWSLHLALEVPVENVTARTLSWGASGEILVGSNYLRLYSTGDGGKVIWERKLASPVARALFCNDADLLATHGTHDRLVKVDASHLDQTLYNLTSAI